MEEMDILTNKAKNIEDALKTITEGNNKETELELPEIEIRDIKGNSFTIRVMNSYKEGTEFEYYVDGAKIGEKTNSIECVVNNKKFNTEYEVKVIVYSEGEQKETVKK